jgi:hypothetical protein
VKGVISRSGFVVTVSPFDDLSCYATTLWRVP